MSRGTLPDDHPNFANAARSQALSGADVIVMFDFAVRKNLANSLHTAALALPSCGGAETAILTAEPSGSSMTPSIRLRPARGVTRTRRCMPVSVTCQADRPLKGLAEN